MLLILGFAAARKFEDSQEAIPVETVSETQLNQIMNGEKDAKPAPLPPPAPRPDAKAEPTPPTPPPPPPELRTADAPQPAPTPPPKPEATPSKPEPTPPPKPEPAPTPKQADIAKPLPQPPERPKDPAPVKPKSEAAAKADPIAKALERDKPDAKPAPTYDPNAIAKLIAPKASPAANATNVASTTPQGLPHHDAPRMSVSMASALDAWLTESYLNCWTPPPTMPEGDVYVAEIKVVLNVDGSLSARPVLLNPPDDPAWRAHAESAMRAVRKCDPLHVPPEYAPYFEEWKIETIHFDPRETQG